MIINFFRNLEILQKLAAPRENSFKKIVCVWQEQRAMCHFNRPWSQVPIPSLAVALKMTVQIPLQVQEKAELTSVAKNSMYL